MVGGMPGGAARDLAYQRLSALLDRGVYPAGSRLPGERALAEQLGVSRSTLRLALSRLAEEARLSASAQRGWFVPQLVLGEPPSQLVSFTELAEQRGLRATAEVLSEQQRPASFEEAGDLQIAAAAPVIEIVRLRRMDGVPITVETAVLPLRRVSWLPEVDLSDRSLYQVLEEHGVGVHRSTYTVQAMIAGEWEAHQLELPLGAAVLVARDVTYTVDRTPIIITVNHYRGDAYRFTADLFRSVG